MRLLSEGDALLALLRGPGGPASEASTLTVQELSNALGAMALLLQASDMKALDAFDQLRTDTLLTSQALFPELQTAVDRLEFDRASGLVADLMKALNS